MARGESVKGRTEMGPGVILISPTLETEAMMDKKNRDDDDDDDDKGKVEEGERIYIVEREGCMSVSKAE